MGYSIRTDAYRYTEWLRWNGTILKADWSNVVGVELYDHTGDEDLSFDSYENVNVANKSSYEEARTQLHDQLKEMFDKEDTVHTEIN